MLKPLPSVGNAPAGFEWLCDTAYNAYSQFGEDGVLEAIFTAIRTENQWCVECGAADGIFFSNTRRLIEQGWHGVLIEADPQAYKRLLANSEPFRTHVNCVLGKVDNDSRLETILGRCGAPVDIDLVVIDVDGQDYHLFNSFLRYRPRVIVVEYGITSDPDFIPAIGAEGQAGENAIMSLGAGRFYAPVWRSSSNVVFVRQPLELGLLNTREAPRGAA